MTAPTARSRASRGPVPGSARVRLGVLLLALSLGVLLGACGGDDGAASTPAPTGQPTAGEPPTNGGSLLNLDEFRKRCLARTTQLQQADLFYQRTAHLVVGRSATYTVVIDNSGKSSVGGLPRQGAIGLACTVQARLVTPGSVTVNPQGWDDQKYLPPRPTSWDWVLTPSAPGSFSGVLQLKPVIQIGNGTSTTDLGTESFPVAFHVTRPHRTLAAKGGSVASDVWKTILGLAGGITVLVGAWVAVRSLFTRSRRGKHATQESTDSTEDASQDA